MTLAHTTPVRSALCNLVVDLVDADAGVGQLDYLLADGTTLVAELKFSAVAFLTSTDGSAAAADITSDPSAIGHASDVAVFIISDGAGLEVYRGSLGLNSSDINLSSLNISATDIVSCSSLVYTASA